MSRSEPLKWLTVVLLVIALALAIWAWQLSAQIDPFDETSRFSDFSPEALVAIEEQVRTLWNLTGVFIMTGIAALIATFLTRPETARH